MVVELQGVLVDGTNPDIVAVPPNTRQLLTFAKGESVTVRVKIVTSADFPAASSGTVVMTVKKQPQQIPPIFTATGAWSATEPGVAILEVTPANTRLMEFGWYCYDIWLLRDAGARRDQIVAVSPLVIQPTALAVP